MFYHVSFLDEAGPSLYGLGPIQGSNFRLCQQSSHNFPPACFRIVLRT